MKTPRGADTTADGGKIWAQTLYALVNDILKVSECLLSAARSDL